MASVVLVSDWWLPPSWLRWVHPAILDWPDRRPIGALFLSRDATGWTKNPRGWFGDADLDVTTAIGLTTFRNDLLAYAERSIRTLAQVGAQGIIVWDLEGQQYPHPDASYVGDPTRLVRVAPEMELWADEFFAKFSKSGYRTGVCVRPQRLVFRPDGHFIQTEYFLNADAIFEELDRKIRYAHDRWGCTLFYVDSNRGPENLGVYAPGIFTRLLKKYPDILLIPEHENRAYFGATAPYYDFRTMDQWPFTKALADQVTSAYPRAVSVVQTADLNFGVYRDRLESAVRRGDIPLFRGWFQSDEATMLPQIYRSIKH